MTREIIAQAKQLADKGLPKDGREKLADVLKNIQDRPEAMSVLAWCYEKDGDLHTASYLYKIALDLEPSDENLIASRVRCENEIKIKLDQVGSRKPGIGSILFPLLVVLLGLGLVILSYSGILSDFADALFDMEIMEYEIIITIAGFVLAALGIILFIASLVRRILHASRMKKARGEDFTDRAHIPCRVCSLRYLEKQSICPYCNSPQREPKPEPKPEETQEAPTQKDAPQLRSATSAPPSSVPEDLPTLPPYAPPSSGAPITAEDRITVSASSPEPVTHSPKTESPSDVSALMFDIPGFRESSAPRSSQPQPSAAGAGLPPSPPAPPPHSPASRRGRPERWAAERSAR